MSTTGDPLAGRVPVPDVVVWAGWEGAAMTAQLTHTTRELDSRSSDGIHVRLLWSERDNRASVAVADTKTGDGFAVEVRECDNALDVFHHPFAYAAWQRIDTGSIPQRGNPVERIAA